MRICKRTLAEASTTSCQNRTLTRSRLITEKPTSLADGSYFGTVPKHDQMHQSRGERRSRVRQAHRYPHFFRISFIRRASSIIAPVPGVQTAGEEAASIGPVSASHQWAAGSRTRGISTPTGFYNKAWGRRDNGAPQESLPCDSNPSGVQQFCNT